MNSLSAIRIQLNRVGKEPIHIHNSLNHAKCSNLETTRVENKYECEDVDQSPIH